MHIHLEGQEIVSLTCEEAIALATQAVQAELKHRGIQEADPNQTELPLEPETKEWNGLGGTGPEGEVSGGENVMMETAQESDSASDNPASESLPDKDTPPGVRNEEQDIAAQADMGTPSYGGVNKRAE